MTVLGEQASKANYERMLDIGKRYLDKNDELTIGTIVLDKGNATDLKCIIGALAAQLSAQAEYIEGQQQKMIGLARSVDVLKGELAAAASRRATVTSIDGGKKR